MTDVSSVMASVAWPSVTSQPPNFKTEAMPNENRIMPPLSWPNLFKAIKTTTQSDLLPFVTRLKDKTYTSPSQKAFVILLSTILSLRTRDKVCEDTTLRLLKLGKSPKTLLNLPLKKIEDAIYPSAFYKTKAKQIQKICEILLEKYQGKTPEILDDLLSLPGVGRKTANLVLTEGYDKPGICVDTHVHRILNRIGQLKTKTPDETEMVLREILPKRYWKTINKWLVMFGQYHCLPRNPKCETCLIKKHCQFTLSNKMTQ